ncbi:unnamed protein product [Brugia timori]|uniref:TPR_REGION domain-containing protein n=1 Tax=Brugia timori TaxID=42155 RepID=A0A0R3R7A4_9BILA|nr:unnamed protein product [Brugia timori]
MPGFSNENTFWLGKAQLALGRKKDACESFKKAKTLTPRYRNEYKVFLYRAVTSFLCPLFFDDFYSYRMTNLLSHFQTGVQAREFLLKKCRMRVEDIPDSACPY